MRKDVKDLLVNLGVDLIWTAIKYKNGTEGTFEDIMNN